MRQNVRDFVSVAAAALPFQEPIFEFGSLLVPGQESFADVRPLFPGRAYVGADIRPGAGVDQVLDLHDINLPAGSVGTVLCLDTLEHVEYPHRALEEIFRILKPGGIVVITSVMLFGIHDFPHDYWRFTPEAFRSILKPFSQSFVGYAGFEHFPHTVVGIGFKGVVPNLSEMLSSYEKWHREQEEIKPGALKRAAKLIVPPIFVKVVRTLLR